MADSELDRLKAQRDALNAKIQRKAAQETQRKKKERDARLIRWGMVIESMIEADEIAPERWGTKCSKHLTRKTDLQRAFTGPLEGLDQMSQPAGDAQTSSSTDTPEADPKT